jgi:uncharacterized protein (TIGR03118 family)
VHTRTCERSFRLSIATLLLLVAACGGGYGGSGSGASVPPPTVALSVQPTAITAGQTATLRWSTSGAGTCTASGAWSGTQATDGTEAVSPTAVGSNTFTLTCAGSGAASGSTSASATLSVTAASGFSVTKLVADSAGVGAITSDTNLVNPWGIAIAPGKPAWVANNHSATATFYDGNGQPQPTASPLVLQLPAGAGSVAFAPTGVVANVSSVDFVLTSGPRTGVARLMFAGEAGMIAGWSPTVNTNPLIVYTDGGGAVYKGLALANNGQGNFVYATDFHNNKVDVLDASFTRQVPTAAMFAFHDPALPAGYAPFGIQALATGAAGAVQLYVTYAQQLGPDNRLNGTGAGLGLVNVFDTNGNLVKHLIPVGAQLNAPWGLALAPADFGSLSKLLLVGNFGDGRINAFDPSSGRFMGAMLDGAGTVIAEPGLWGIVFGNNAANQPHNTLFFAAGVNNQADGIYGRIDLGAAPLLNAPPIVSLAAPSGSVTGTVPLSATVADPANIAIAGVSFFANDTLIGTVSAAPFSVQWDTATAPAGSVALTAVATDVDGNVGMSTVVRVTVE